MARMIRVQVFAALAALGCLMGLGGRLPLVRDANAAPPQGAQVPKFEVDPTWPKPWKNMWVTGEIGGTCIDAQDHIFILNRGVLTGDEQRNSRPAPAVIEMDPQGNVVNSWGDRKVLPNGGLHGCFVDNENNIWIGSSGDGIIQKYTHDGSKLLLQIGTRGKIDAYDTSLAPVGYQKAVAPTNSSHTSLNDPACMFVDSSNGDIYVADGYGNRRVVVFDKDGHYLRQWGRQATLDEAKQGVGGVFLDTVHCVVIDNAGLVYVCDRKGDRIQVFDKMGTFKKNIWIQKGTGLDRGLPGSAWWLVFSRDPQQRYMYVVDGGNERIWILDHNSGEILSGFGQPGHQLGSFSFLHTITVDSQGNIYTGETINGRRAQKFRMTGMQPAGTLPEVRTDIPGPAGATGVGPG